MSFNSLFGLGSHSEDASLECWLLMQETTGTTVADQSSNARDGTLNGATSPDATTGPNSYLTSAFHFDAVDDYVAVPTTALVGGTSVRTYLIWVNADTFPTDTSNPVFDFGEANGTPGNNGKGLSCLLEDQAISAGFYGNRTITPKTTLSTGTWYLIAVRVPSGATTTADVDILIDGVNQTLTNEGGSSQTLATVVVNNTIGRSYNSNIPSTAYGDFIGCSYASFSRAMSDAEVLEVKNGPEPVNTAAGTVSGDTAQGSTLTANAGTWALPAPFSSGSNGSVSSAFQWTRDGVNIAGATGSTYVTQEADIGAAIGFKELASNNGGSDAAEETASSNTISVVSATTTYRMNMQLFIPTQS